LLGESGDYTGFWVGNQFPGNAVWFVPALGSSRLKPRMK